jgi:hypothetical protein
MRLYISILVISSFVSIHVDSFASFAAMKRKQQHCHDDYQLKKSNNIQFRPNPLFSTAVRGVLVMDVLSVKVKEYMVIRSQNSTSNFILNATIVTQNRDGREKKKENPLAFVKPSGWYKDEVEIDLKKRSDNAVPRVLHPLSNVELKKYGFADLTDSIIYYGGPYSVGEQVGIDWVEPDIPKEIWEEALRPVRTITYNLGVTGSLRLGSALDDTLALAEGMDLGELKERLSIKKLQNVTSTPIASVEDPQYKTTGVSKPVASPLDANTERIRLEERFTLNTLQRLNFGSVCLLNAIAWGRASQDMIANHILGDGTGSLIDVIKVVAIGVLVVDGGSAAVTTFTAKSKNRNQLVWLMKALFGGVFAVTELKGLPDLNMSGAPSGSLDTVPEGL